GDASYQDLVKQGYLSAAIINYLLLLGWSPKGDQEIFSREDMIEKWNPAWINKSPAIFDIQKLRAINAGYINRMSDEEFTEIARPWIETVVKTPIDLNLLCMNLKPRCEILSDLPDRVMFIDHMPEEYDLAFYRNKKFKTDESTSLTALKAILPALEANEDWTREGVYNACAPLAQEMGVKGGWLLYPLGIALAGTQATPGGGTDLAVIIGKERTLERVRKAIDVLTAATA
ncbi:MAG: hypothetical protein IKX88_05450, partial [Thermoguttaceae bacterium]|nr:hypothetical protein [Thermoguttaceae bacterium]